jgi:hypothetical protein
MKKTSPSGGAKASQQIAKYIAGHADWRGSMLARLRKIIQEAAPELEEDVKWGVPVWSHQGLVCSIAAFKEHVKVNFFQGAGLKDPKRLLNAGAESKTMRAIDLHEGDRIDAPGLKVLVRAAVANNVRSRSSK